MADVWLIFHMCRSFYQHGSKFYIAFFQKCIFKFCNFFLAMLRMDSFLFALLRQPITHQKDLQFSSWWSLVLCISFSLLPAQLSKAQDPASVLGAAPRSVLKGTRGSSEGSQPVVISCAPSPPSWGQVLVFAPSLLTLPHLPTAPTFLVLFSAEQYLLSLLMPLFFGASWYFQAFYSVFIAVQCVLFIVSESIAHGSTEYRGAFDRVLAGNMNMEALSELSAYSLPAQPRRREPLLPVLFLFGSFQPRAKEGEVWSQESF